MQIQITGPMVNGMEMDAGCMSFRKFLSRFEHYVASIANDTERLNFLKCRPSGRASLLINHLSICNNIGGGPYLMKMKTLTIFFGIY